jgi:hypothetical protein
MRGIGAPASERSRSAISTQIVAVGVVVIVLIAGAAGYFLLLRPGSSTTTSQSTETNGVVGNSQTHPVSANRLYQLYQLGTVATDVPAYTNHTVYATGNLTAIIHEQTDNQMLTAVDTGGNAFEYWYWHNSTGLPPVAENQAVLAHCFVTGLVRQQNGTSFLYLKSCDLISVQGSNSFG